MKDLLSLTMEMDVEEDQQSMSVEEAVVKAHQFLAPVLGKGITHEDGKLSIDAKIKQTYRKINL